MADRRDLGRTFGLLIAALAGVTVLGFGAGLLFGRVSPERAASSLLDEFVADTAPPGESREVPACGLRASPVDDATLDAVRDAGGIAIAYLPEVVDLEALRALVAAFPETLLVAPDPGLDGRVVARSRTRVMALEEVDQRLLGAFATAYGQPVCEAGAASPGG